MIKFKNILSILLVILMLFSCVPVFATETDDNICGVDATWSYSAKTQTLTISGTGPTDFYFVEFDQCPPWYSYRNNIKNVIIEKGITGIGSDFFKDCTNLSSVTISNSVTHIESQAFENCTNLNSISIPDSVTSIGYNAFYNTAYYNNTNNWENEALYIGKHLIDTTYYLAGSYTVKPDTKSVADFAFSGNDLITEVVLPNGITNIGLGLFNWCFNLEKIIIPNSVTSINGFAFESCEKLTEISIPNNVKLIGDNAFNNCTGLKSIIIPDSVTTIEMGAFANCTNLSDITISSNNTRIYRDAFYNTACYNNKTNWVNDMLYIDNYLISVKDTLAGNCRIKDGTRAISVSVFYDCTNPFTITLPNSLTVINEHAFAYCSGLTGITIPDSITEIEEAAFYGCENLTKITIPQSVTKINSIAFAECENLSEITIKNEKTQIYTYSLPYTATIYAPCYEYKQDNWYSAYSYTQNKFCEMEFVSTKHLFEQTDAATHTCSVCGFSKPNTGFEAGDIDGDGKVSAADARLALRMSVGLEDVITLADVDKDGKISAADARLILRKSVGLENF